MKSPLILVMALALTGSSHAAWNRLPTPDAQQVNVASRPLFKSGIMSASDNIKNPAALIGDDVVPSTTIPSGHSEIVLQFDRQMVISSVGFANMEYQGKVTVSASVEGTNWTSVVQQPCSGSDYRVNLVFAGIQAKYVKLGFEASKSGKIRAFTLEGVPVDKDITQKKLTKEQQADKPLDSVVRGASLASTVNLANGFARVIYANPTPTNIGTENFGRGSLKFPRTNDKYRTIIYDLGSLRLIKQFEAAYAPKRVRLEVFIFDELPEKKDWRGKLTFDPVVFDQTKPAAVAEDPRGVGHVRVNLIHPKTARFVALRFELNYGRSTVASGDGEWGMEFLSGISNPVEKIIGMIRGTESGKYVVGAVDDGGWDVSIGLNGFTGIASRGSDTSSHSDSVTNADGSTTTTTTYAFADGSTAEAVTTTMPDGSSHTQGSVTDPAGRTTSFVTDTKVNPDGSTTTTGSYSEPGGKVTRFETIVFPDGSTTTTTTDSSGNKETKTTPPTNNNNTEGGGPGFINGAPGAPPATLPTKPATTTTTGTTNTGGATVTIPPPASP